MNSSNNTNPVTINNEIYDAAIHYDKNKLIQLQEKYGTLDIKCDGFTVGGLLGKKGKINQAQFLYNNFNINLDNVVYGIAAANKTNLLQHELFQGLDVFSKKLTLLIEGYARGNHLDEMQTIIKQEIEKIKSNQSHYPLQDIITAPMEELARNGQFAIISSLMHLIIDLKNTKPFKDSNLGHSQIAIILLGRAKGATLKPDVRFEEISEQIKTGNIFYTDFYSLTAIQGAAQAGNIPLLEKLIQHCVVADSNGVTTVTGETRKMREAMKGAAKGGHIGLVKQIINNRQNDAKSFFAQACEDALREGHFWIIKELISTYPAFTIVFSEKESCYASGTHFNNLMSIAIQEEQFEVVRQLQPYDPGNSFKNYFYDCGTLQTRSSSTKECDRALSKLMQDTMKLTTRNQEIKAWQTNFEYKSDKYNESENKYQSNKLLIAATQREVLNHLRFKFFANKGVQQESAPNFKSYLKKLAVGKGDSYSHKSDEFIFDHEVYPGLHKKDGLIKQTMQRYHFNPGQALLLSDYCAIVLFLQGTQKLPLELLFIMARTLFDLSNSDRDLTDVRNTMLHIRKNLFKPKLEKDAAMDVSEDNVVSQTVNSNNMI